MTLRLAIAVAAAMTLLTAGASRAQHEVVTKTDIEYVQHGGAKLAGDLYLPKGVAKAPVVIAVHGGGWQNGNRATWKNFGPHLTKHGFGMFAISYRLGKAGIYPGEVYDVKAAIQFVRAKAADLGVDPERIGLMGASAGGHLVSLVGLAHDQFASEYRDAPHAGAPAGVKAVVSFYGIYDMVAQWQHDQISRPRDQITEKFLGATPAQNRKVYFESSPMSYATIGQNRARFFLIHGTEDDIVDPNTQARPFLDALKQAGINANRLVIQGAGHGFASEPIDGEPNGYMAATAPKILRFLEGGL
jgi:acetyl esterase/lipase